MSIELKEELKEAILSGEKTDDELLAIIKEFKDITDAQVDAIFKKVKEVTSIADANNIPTLVDELLGQQPQPAAAPEQSNSVTETKPEENINKEQTKTETVSENETIAETKTTAENVAEVAPKNEVQEQVKEEPKAQEEVVKQNEQTSVPTPKAAENSTTEQTTQDMQKNQELEQTKVDKNVQTDETAQYNSLSDEEKAAQMVTIKDLAQTLEDQHKDSQERQRLENTLFTPLKMLRVVGAREEISEKIIDLAIDKSKGKIDIEGLKKALEQLKQELGSNPDEIITEIIKVFSDK